MVRVEWDPIGKLIEVTVPDVPVLDGDLAQETVERLEQLTQGQDRVLLLVDGKALKRGTLDWSVTLVSFLLKNKERVRVGIYSGGHSLDGLEGWAESTGMEIARFPSRDEAGRWLIGQKRQRLLGD